MSNPADLTLKQKKFLEVYFETGNATEAAMQAYDCKDRKTAKSIGNENLTKLDLTVIMEAKGLTDDNLMNHVVEGLTLPIKVTADGIETPDYGVRHRYLETALRLKGHGEENKNLTQINVGEMKVNFE